jgi:hypothetical protein
VIPPKTKGDAKNILPLLHAAERDGWHHLATGDESWSFFDPSAHRLRTSARDDVFIKRRLNIQSKKFMLPIILNRRGFYVVGRLPNDMISKAPIL